MGAQNGLGFDDGGDGVALCAWEWDEDVAVDSSEFSTRSRVGDASSCRRDSYPSCY